MNPIKYEEIEFAFDISSSDPYGDTHAFICLATGKMYCDIDGMDEEIPEDLYDEEKYLAVPTKQDLGLGKPLALEYAKRDLPEHYELVYSYFNSRGAYSRFKGLLDEMGALEGWYEYEQTKTREALLSWCKENEIEVGI